MLSQDSDAPYSLTFLVMSSVSGGSPALQSTVQVTINIVDVNDNSPIITPSSYVAGVKENLPSGQSVLRVCTPKLACNYSLPQQIMLGSILA